MKQPLEERLSILLRNLSRLLGELLTSTFVVIIVMLTFLVGIASHLQTVFESWFLALGFQAVVLIASVNSDILPSKVTESGIRISILPFVLSLFMFWFIFISFSGPDFVMKDEWWKATIALTKAFAMSAVELMFSYIFAARWESDKQIRNAAAKTAGSIFKNDFNNLP